LKPQTTAQGVVDTPFRIVSQTLHNDDGTTILQLGVISNSHLFNSEDRDTYEEDNSDWGLLGDAQDTDDPNWFNAGELNMGDKIWLEISLDLQIKTSQESSNWGQVGLMIGHTTRARLKLTPTTAHPEFYHQIIRRLRISRRIPGRRALPISPETAYEAQVVQLLRTNLMMTTAATTDDADEAGKLLVAILGKRTWGNADEINSDDDIMTPWALGPVAESGSTVAFSVIDVSTGNTLAIKVLDGHVNFEYPTGMGFDNFVLNISSSTTVYLIITYNQTTLAITSRTITTGTTPDSTAGTVYIELADITVAGGALEIEQLHEGNINMALVYGAFNGAPAIIPLRALSNWAAVT
jgi:hypothetical protein